jgi:hypothetical protein
MTATPKVLCAIYTRKSTEEGLDQNFNSLDAQHDACANYIASQKSEGWVMLKDRYDDGGFSGGTLERPAIKRLLEDVRKSLEKSLNDKFGYVPNNITPLVPRGVLPTSSHHNLG